MNWDIVNAVSEILGVVVVVITLVYLARQIQESTNLAKTEYHTNSVTTMARFRDWKSASIDNARIFRVGMNDFRALTPDERITLDGVLLDLVLCLKDILEAHERGFMDKETYGAWVSFVGATIAMPGGQMWWQQARQMFISKVQTVIDSAITQCPPFQELMPIVIEGEA
jgi:hypothetical protein